MHINWCEWKKSLRTCNNGALVFQFFYITNEKPIRMKTKPVGIPKNGSLSCNINVFT